jgi:hypothetical protein
MLALDSCSSRGGGSIAFEQLARGWSGLDLTSTNLRASRIDFSSGVGSRHVLDSSSAQAPPAQSIMNASLQSVVHCGLISVQTANKRRCVPCSDKLRQAPAPTCVVVQAAAALETLQACEKLTGGTATRAMLVNMKCLRFKTTKACGKSNMIIDIRWFAGI